MEVPLINMSSFFEQSARTTALHDIEKDAAMKEVANQIRSACESHGFFYVTGLSAETMDLMSTALAQTKQFFVNDNEDFMKHYKIQCASKNSKLYRGYTRTGGGNNCDLASKTPELKESFTIGAEGGGKSPMHGPNLWPTATGFSTNEEEFCKSFRQGMSIYFDCMLQLSKHVAHALALSLNLQDDFFTSRMTDPVAQLVAFKYPPEEGGESNGSKTVSCGEHTDCGFLTLLTQTEKGLEVYSQATNTWHIVEPIENAVLVNLGDLTQFWTKGKYKSTPHRVHNKSPNGIDRYSLVFFANCDFDAYLDDMDGQDNCDTHGEAGNDKGGKLAEYNGDAVITAGEYILEKLGLMWLMNENGK